MRHGLKDVGAYRDWRENLPSRLKNVLWRVSDTYVIELILAIPIRDGCAWKNLLGTKRIRTPENCESNFHDLRESLNKPKRFDMCQDEIMVPTGE